MVAFNVLTFLSATGWYMTSDETISWGYSLQHDNNNVYIFCWDSVWFWCLRVVQKIAVNFNNTFAFVFIWVYFETTYLWVSSRYKIPSLQWLLLKAANSMILLNVILEILSLNNKHNDIYLSKALCYIVARLRVLESGTGFGWCVSNPKTTFNITCHFNFFTCFLVEALTDVCPRILAYNYGFRIIFRPATHNSISRSQWHRHLLQAPDRLLPSIQQVLHSSGIQLHQTFLWVRWKGKLRGWGKQQVLVSGVD